MSSIFKISPYILCIFFGNFLLQPSLSHAEKDIEIEWYATTTYSEKSVQVGDTIIFKWDDGDEDHDAYIYPSGDCSNEDGKIKVGNYSPSTYTFSEEDIGKTLFFGCTVDDHCKSGHHINVSVTADSTETTNGSGAIPKGETKKIEWFIKQYSGISAQVGDTVTFEWDDFERHDVHIYPSGGCSDEAGIIEVGQNSPASYTFQETDIGTTLFFGCTVGRHCRNGQHIDVTVSVAGGNSNNIDEKDDTETVGNNDNDAETASETSSSASDSYKHLRIFTIIITMSNVVVNFI